MAYAPIEGMELLDVNHIDENKSNNSLNNLEWRTHKDNCNYGARNERIKESMIGNYKGYRKGKAN